MSPARKQQSKTSFQMIEFVLLAVATMLLIGLGLMFVYWRCLIVVDEGFVAIVDVAQTNQRKVLRNGWHLLLPGFELVRIRTRVSSAFDAPTVESERMDCRARLYDLEPFVINANDNAQIYIEASLLYRVTDPLVILTQKADVYELLKAVVISNLLRAAATIPSQAVVQSSYNGVLRQFLIDGLKEITPSRMGITIEK